MHHDVPAGTSCPVEREDQVKPNPPVHQPRARQSSFALAELRSALPNLALRGRASLLPSFALHCRIWLYGVKGAGFAGASGRRARLAHDLRPWAAAPAALLLWRTYDRSARVRACSRLTSLRNVVSTSAAS